MVWLPLVGTWGGGGTQELETFLEWASMPDGVKVVDSGDERAGRNQGTVSWNCWDVHFWGCVAGTWKGLSDGPLPSCDSHRPHPPL